MFFMKSKINPSNVKKLLEIYEKIDVSKIEEIWNYCMAGLMEILPFTWYIARKLTVIYDPYFLEAPAAVDKMGRLILGPMFLHLISQHKTFTIAHEVMHIALEHPWRGEEYVKTREDKYPPNVLTKVYNIAADGIVNEVLKQLGILQSNKLHMDDFRVDKGNVNISYKNVLLPLWQMFNFIPLIPPDIERGEYMLITFELIAERFRIEKEKLNLERFAEEISDDILSKIKVIRIPCPIAQMLKEIEELKKKRCGKGRFGGKKGEEKKEGGGGKEEKKEGDKEKECGGSGGEDLEELEKKLKEICKQCKGSGRGTHGDSTCPFPNASDVLDHEYKPSDKAKTIQKGSLEDELKKKNPSEVIKQIVREAYVYQKTIGTVPAGLARLIEKLLESRIHWKLLLRSLLTVAEGSNATILWHIENPVFGTVPNYLQLGVRTILWLVDTSGSISQIELEQIASEIQACNRHAEVIVIPWDATAYEPIICKKPSECIQKLKIKMYGGGGTVIKPALEKALQIAIKKRPQMLIIASDGHIFDLYEHEDNETTQLLEKLVKLCRKTIFITTDVIPKPIEKMKIDVIKIPIEEKS